MKLALPLTMLLSGVAGSDAKLRGGAVTNASIDQGSQPPPTSQTNSLNFADASHRRAATCDLAVTNTALSALQNFSVEGQQCADTIGDAKSVAEKAKKYYCTRKDLASKARNIKTAIGKVTNVIDKNRHIIKNIPYLGSPIIAMEKTLGEASEKVFKVIGDDYEAMDRRCKNLTTVTNKLEKYKGHVDESTKYADLAHTNLQDLKAWTTDNECCLDQQLDNIVQAVNADMVVLATEVYKTCNGDINIPSFDFSLPDLALMDDIERVANEVSAWIEKTIGEFMDGADYHQCCSPTLSFLVDLVSDISGLAMCPVTGATSGVVSESFDVLLPLISDDIVDVVNKEGEKLNSSSSSINSLLSALDQYGIPKFAATSAWDTVCSLDVELPQALLGYQQILPPSMLTFKPLEPPEADGSFDLAAIGNAIKDECADAAKAFTENIDCCPAATIKVYGSYPFAHNDESCTYDTDCHGISVNNFWYKYEKPGNCALVGSGYGSRCTDGKSGSYCGTDVDCNGQCVAYGIGNGSFCSDGKEGGECLRSVFTPHTYEY
jgi:hypothetical protein